MRTETNTVKSDAPSRGMKGRRGFCFLLDGEGETKAKRDVEQLRGVDVVGNGYTGNVGDVSASKRKEAIFAQRRERERERVRKET